MEMPKLFLTDDLIMTAHCPAGKGQEIYWDYAVASGGQIRNGSISGLGLRVTALGHKSFVHAYQYNGRRFRVVLGSVVTMSVASARMAVIERPKKLEAGENPDSERVDHRRKHFMTVREAIDGYWESHVSKLSPGYQATFGMFVARWLKKTAKTDSKRGHNIRRGYIDFGTMFEHARFSSIKPLDIEAFTKQFASPHSHNDALARVSALFTWAIRMQLVDIRNPCHPIRARKTIRRRRDYSMEQIRRIATHVFYPVLDAVPDVRMLEGMEKRDRALDKAHIVTANEQMTELCNYMGILFLTMARPSDLTKAEFDHFDLDKLIWHKHNTKGIQLSRSLHEYAFRSVPIHPRVADMVQAQRMLWPNAKLVFPSHGDPNQPRDNFRKGLARFKQLDGVPAHFQLYDLKRIAISLMLTGQGVSHEAISHYVDHKGNLETTMIYDLGLVDPLRPVSQRLGELLGV